MTTTKLKRCPEHKEKRGYVQWHTWAEEQTKKGKKQVQCPKCKLWLFQEEL